MNCRAIVALFLQVAICAPVICEAAERYVITELHFPDSYSFVYRLSPHGQVTGTAYVPDYQAYLWTPTTANGTTGAMTLLGDLPGSFERSYGIGINSQGQVVGKGTATTGDRAFLWTPTMPNGTTGSIIDLGELPGGFDDSIAWAINSYGQVVGESDSRVLSTQLGGRAFLWSPESANGTAGTMIDLGTLGGPNSDARDISDRGQVVGASKTGGPRSPIFAYLWSPDSRNGTVGSMISLSDLPGGSSYSQAWGINSYGQVVGNGSTGEGTRAFLWTPNAPNGTTGAMIDLGLLPAHDEFSYAVSVNSLGHVVGYSGEAGDIRAFIWIPDTANGTNGVLHDLNTFIDPAAGWTLKYAGGINDFGQIIGSGLYDADGPGGASAVTRSFLLTPIYVPEPATVASCVLAVVIIAASWRNSRKGR